jgi:ABC-2 type transport system permease protein
MRIKENWIAFKTIVNKEVVRFMRIWIQTILPPAITVVLYFLIFGKLIGSQINPISGFNYMDFIAPGLIMMSIITNAYSNVVSSFFSIRFQRSIEEMLVSPMSNSVIITGYIVAGILRGLMVGLTVTILALFFTRLHMQHPFVMFISAFLAATLFSLAGFTNGLFAKTFDDISIIPTFILTPLTYLGGVFYSIDLLPPAWQPIALLNPIVYMVNAFRYGILGISDVHLGTAFGLIILAIIFLFSINLYFLNRGMGIRT